MNISFISSIFLTLCYYRNIICVSSTLNLLDHYILLIVFASRTMEKFSCIHTLEMKNQANLTRSHRNTHHKWLCELYDQLLFLNADAVPLNFTLDFNHSFNNASPDLHPRLWDRLWEVILAAAMKMWQNRDRQFRGWQGDSLPTNCGQLVFYSVKRETTFSIQRLP